MNKIEAMARAWIGTPYMHQQSVQGVGVDCLGLVRGVWRELIGQEPCLLPAYTADWQEIGGKEALWAAFQHYLVPVPCTASGEGHVVLFRMHKEAPAKHAGILVAGQGAEGSFIHAYSGRGVVETPLNRAWQKRIVAQFRFPEKEAVWQP